MAYSRLQAMLVVTGFACVIHACGPETERETLTSRALCDSAESGIEDPFEVNLSGRVSTRTMSTAIACSGDDACCNYTWTAYVVECPDGDIVLTADGAPYGRETVSGESVDDDFGAVEVTLGCQGVECDATCVPRDDAEFGTVRARLEPATDGFVNPGEGFEEFEALARLVVEEQVSD